jgi:type IV pilus assembly protein PilV
VLVAALVGTVGLLGIAALMTKTAKANHAAFEDAQAAFAAQSLIDAMHVNPAAIAANAYAGSFDAARNATADCAAQACDPTQRAGYDRARFGRAIAAALPNAAANLKCDIDASSGTTTCRLEVDWSAQALATNDASTAQSRVWIFTP